LPDLYEVLRSGPESKRRLARFEGENVDVIGRAADALKNEDILDMGK
jgi:hypothetical protein